MNKLGKYFTQSKEKGYEGLPLLSVTLDSGLVRRNSLDRRTETKLKADEHLLVRKNYIAYNMMRVWQGALGRATEDGLVSPAYVVLKPKEVVNSVFMEYLFKSHRMIYLFWAYSYGLTNDRLRLYYKDFKNIPVNIPPLAEQEKIAEILSTWDQTIEQTERLKTNAEMHKKALMQQLLTGKKRFPEFGGEWRTIKLGDYAKMQSGGTPRTTIAEYYDNGKIPWVSISDMTAQGKYINKTDRNITNKGLENSSAKLYPRGTVLYAMYASIGEVSIASVDLTSSQAILGIQPNPEVINNHYLYFYLKSLQEKIILMGQQGTQSNLNAGMVKGFRLSLPVLEEQQKIASVLNTADREIELLTKKIEHLKSEKRALMQQLLTGKRRVKVDG